MLKRLSMKAQFLVVLLTDLVVLLTDLVALLIDLPWVPHLKVKYTSKMMIDFNC
jgi:hypothetical protein